MPARLHPQRIAFAHHGIADDEAVLELGSLRNRCAISRLLLVFARRPRSYYADASAQKLPFPV